MCSSQKLCENNDCTICFNKSFESIDKSKFWSNQNTLNPRQVFKSSSKKYWFDCNECNHSFNSIMSDITRGRWCPYCSSKLLCENNDCTICFNKSFASVNKSTFWSLKNKLKPRQVFKNSLKKFIFNCECTHEFEIIIANVTNLNNWCSYCCYPPQKLCENNSCKECFNNSFASHPRSKFWSDKNKLTPRHIFKSAHSKYIFNCNVCKNDFSSTIKDITIKNSWCPFCKNKTELKLFEWLKANYKNTVFQPRFDWCKDKRKLPFDFLLEEFKLFIELDGAQHFEQVSNWKSPEETQIVDKFKMECALENGYSIIRIKQDDVWNNKIDWKEILLNNIKQYDSRIIILY